MRCLRHVFLRGAMAVGLLACGGFGALALPVPAAPACADEAFLQAPASDHAVASASHAEASARDC